MTTIQLKKSIVKALSRLKKYDRQTYGEIILDLVNFAKSERMSEEYEEFVKMAQQKRMKELWDTKEDEAWENV